VKNSGFIFIFPPNTSIKRKADTDACDGSGHFGSKSDVAETTDCERNRKIKFELLHILRIHRT
jgi:hypothetical protein